MAAIYLGSQLLYNGAGGGAEPDSNGWMRPSDWLPMPTLTETDEVVAMLYAVYPNGRNFVAVKFSGAYTVDWGDGTSGDFTSGATAQHEYDFDDAALDGSLTSAGYKQALILVTPQSSNSLTSIETGIKPSIVALPSNVSGNALDIAIAAPNATSILITTGFYKYYSLERVRFIKTGQLSTCENLLTGLDALVSVDFSGINTTGASLFKNFLSSCSSIKKIDFSPIDFSSATTIEMFSLNAKSLIELDLSNADLSNITTAVNIVSTVLVGLTKFIAPIPVSFSVANNLLNAEALNALFTSLPSVTGQTVTVSGNYGVNEVGYDPSIATAKGWTVA